ncbi:kinase-like domain-containing protein [Absidia repens]|uniref:Kinase-like domain-containing protein n=1 Tax=Absidia repens TaxID=90262 RepID=A0A1X2ISK0_9FUNG|nr:kinase-like domain-containing protein [Absidia repens]
MTNKMNKVFLLKRMRAQLGDTYERQNSEYQYKSTNLPKWILPKRSKAAKNDGFDDDDYDFILKVDDILDEEKEYQSSITKSMEVEISKQLSSKFDSKGIHHILTLRHTFTYKNHPSATGHSISLKDAKIIHCNLKPESILLTSFDTPIIKVIDFGLACHEANKIHMCIVAEIFLGIPLFPGNLEYNWLQRIIDMIGMPPQDMLDKELNSDEFFFNKESKGNGNYIYTMKSLEQYLVQRHSMIDFLQGLLELNPLKRWTPQQARYHPFVTGESFIKASNPNNLARKQVSTTTESHNQSALLQSTSSGNSVMQQRLTKAAILAHKATWLSNTDTINNLHLDYTTSTSHGYNNTDNITITLASQHSSALQKPTITPNVKIQIGSRYACRKSGKDNYSGNNNIMDLSSTKANQKTALIGTAAMVIGWWNLSSHIFSTQTETPILS